MKRLLLALPVAGLMASTALAQSTEVPPYHPEPGPYAGWWELTLAGSGTSTDNFDSNSLGVNVGIGYYLTENIPVNLRQFGGFSLVDGGDDSWSGQTVASIDYQFDFGKWQPFVGFAIGGNYGKATDEDFIYGPEIGLKYYLGEATFAYGQALYTLTGVDNCCNDGVFNYTIGLGWNF